MEVNSGQRPNISTYLATTDNKLLPVPRIRDDLPIDSEITTLCSSEEYTAEKVKMLGLKHLAMCWKATGHIQFCLGLLELPGSLPDPSALISELSGRNTAKINHILHVLFVLALFCVVLHSITLFPHRGHFLKMANC